MCFTFLLALIATTAVSVEAGKQTAEAQVLANPIRKVVTLLQDMQKKVEAEGEKEAKLYEEFMCYCKNGGADLQASISAAETKIPAVSSNIEEGEQRLAQTKADLKQNQEDRSAANTAMAEATALREKEAATFAANKAEYDTNIAAIAKAVAAIEKGVAGGFLQTGAAQVLRKLTLSNLDMLDVDRQELVSFLSGSQSSGYTPKSGEITGILKQMGDTMAKTLSDLTATEEAAKTAYAGLMSAKKKEVSALSASIEAKSKQIGELEVDIVQMKEDLDDTQKALAEDKKFLANLDDMCAKKTAEWEARSKTRTDELVALADTIKVLNDDDALELFKKTLPGASSSFVQMGRSASSVRARALTMVRAAQKAADRHSRAGLDFLALALTGKKFSFDKVITMCDEMVAVLKKEQQDDDHKKEYCLTQLDLADDKKKGLEITVADEETAISNAKEAISTLTEEMAALEAGIKALDKSVAEATETRKEENADHKELMASDAAAKDILGVAKNRLNKFYNPALYKPPAKEELSRDDRIVANMGAAALVQIRAHTQRKDAPAPPPETWGAYSKKSEENSGVIAMVDLLIKDLDTEMQESTQAEKDAQADYETMMQDSAEKRTLDSKTLTEKGEAKASTEAALEGHKDARMAAGKELMATLEYIQSLHTECDWLLQYFDVRKEARAGEIDSLVKAKAVLSGADFSLLQTRKSGYLRH